VQVMRRERERMKKTKEQKEGGPTSPKDAREEGRDYQDQSWLGQLGGKEEIKGGKRCYNFGGT